MHRVILDEQYETIVHKMKDDIFKSRSLLDIANDIKHALFVPIDVQKTFADVNQDRGSIATEFASRNIGRLAPEFNKLGLRSCWVYFSRNNEIKDPAQEVDFHHAIPEKSDFFARKTTDSAFACANDEFQNVLNTTQTRVLFVAGFNANACVVRTVCDALDMGYYVYVVSDLTEDDESVQKELFEEDHRYKGTYNNFISILARHYSEKDTRLGCWRKKVKRNISMVTSEELSQALALKYKMDQKQYKKDRPAGLFKKLTLRS